ncbi:crotonase/enoyl-CoA hydratase family protein [Aestuariirhabdus sp. Z084]|uniref:crotonase/enoyl-CoA hydratase family protein n=1 Tax=Aestuariirhabdus haliotis TaxID=2918751 RepID=UPI00201B3823|nr:crotonase/enoyl-CoA hydratase family protein [Aestuariirhabdus haliotis]MCL6415719.1 crotonase/enoyl-CoA hydratase family protein [Aestuariirhabdus haliotis]MCL6419755.1 crotonase/enoyl-CoA hydratase family protein [Aestuariirhabdus haliotis]
MTPEQSPLVHCTIDSNIATITMDDGQNNLISPTMLDQLNRALDQAEAVNAVVVLTGREEIFSAGFDLKILKTGVVNTFAMLMGGFRLSHRLLSFPTPVIIACNGHAIAMGSFLLLSGDYRIGVQGKSKITANEVEIGLTMPYSAIEICRQRLKPANFDRTVLLSEHYHPESALAAGFLDQIVPASELKSEAKRWATHFASLDLSAHRQSKQRMRRSMLKALRRAMRADQIDFVIRGIKRMLGSK